MDKEKEVNSNQESSNKSQAVVEWLLGEYQIQIYVVCISSINMADWVFSNFGISNIM